MARYSLFAVPCDFAAVRHESASYIEEAADSHSTVLSVAGKQRLESLVEKLDEISARVKDLPSGLEKDRLKAQTSILARQVRIAADIGG